MPDKTEPAISIIMNCLNCADHLGAALESVKEQTFDDYEIIFFDNGSTDESVKIAETFGPKMRIFHNSQTVPLGQARNLAINHARGKFIAFLDCDDLWRPDKLKKQYAMFQRNPALGLVCTDTEIFDGKRVLSRVFDRTRPLRGMVFDVLIERQWISMSSAMVRKFALDSILDKCDLDKEKTPAWFDERFNLCEEADVFYRIAHDWELDHVPEPLTVWRVHGGNATFRKFDQFARETLLILDKFRKIYPNFDQQYSDAVKLLEKRAAFQGSLALWRNNQNSQAREKIRPWLAESAKYKLFWLATFLPGASFDWLSKVYFALPSFLRR